MYSGYNMLQWLVNQYNSITGTIDRNVQNWVNNLLQSFYAFLHTIFGNVSDEWEGFTKAITTLRTGVTDLGTWAHYVLHYILKVWVPQFTQYVDKNALEPLATALKWISDDGKLVTQYLTDPDKLAEFIFDSLIAKLESSAATTAETMGKFLTALFVKNVGLLLRIIEDIIDAAL